MAEEDLLLKSGSKIPALGFGTWPLKGEACFEAVRTALSVGYRHIDTADYYQNHQSIARALKESSVSREDVFLTTKIKPSDLSHDDVLAAGRRFLEELETDYIDLLLIHWPSPKIPIQETLSAMWELWKEKVTHAVGVSNFEINDLKEALETEEAEISVNQIEFHPNLVQSELKRFCDEKDIVVTAYSPLDKGKALLSPTVQKISKKYGRPPSQVVLNWILQKGMVAIPASSNPGHIEENFGALGWELEEEDVRKIDEAESSGD